MGFQGLRPKTAAGRDFRLTAGELKLARMSVMKTTALFSLSLLLYTAAARAQSLEDALAAARRAAVDAKAAASERRLLAQVQAETARVFPVRLVCSPEKASGLPARLVFHTRLDARLVLSDLKERPYTVASQFTPAPGETAAGLDDYRSISVDRQSLRYDLWSCDTQDYYFRFSAAELARDPAKGEPSRPVKARVKIETRGATDYLGEMPCEAIYPTRPSA